VDYQPVPPGSVALTVHHLGAYSSQIDDEEKEVQGTVFQTRWTVHYEKRGNGWSIQRRLDSLVGKGYHKFSMPNELEKKVNLDIELGDDGVPVRVTGYDSLHSILKRIEQRESYREQLLRMSDTVQFQALQRDAFRLRKLLQPGIHKRGDRLDVEAINKQLETMKLDSAVYQGDRPRLELRCLEFETYYHREDSLPLLVEQFFYSAPAHRKWKHSAWQQGKVDGMWHFSVERKTGLPCFESITESGHVVLKDTTDRDTLPISLYRYEEDLYTR